MISPSIADLKADALLEESIRFEKRLPFNLKSPQAIFLTGATGFLGAFLLDEFLRNTAATLYCLVRSDQADQGQQRLKHHLQTLSLWDETCAARVIAVSGDLSQPLLGMTFSEFKELAQSVDFICHSGAQVNSIYPYSKLKTTNVLGTQEMLRFAAVGGTKPLHFISTLAVFLSETYAHAEQTILENDIPVVNEGLKGGYRQSKWVAEQLVMQAQARGLPANIYRTSRIMGQSKTGVMGHLNDFLCSLMRGCLELKKFPTLETEFNLVAVDYISKAIVYLTQQPDLLGKTFHLLNPASISWQQLFNNISHLGYSLEAISYTQWLAELNQQPKNRLYLQLRFLLNAPHALFSEKPHFDSHHTQTALAATSLVCPPIDIELLRTYFAFFQKHGFPGISLTKGGLRNDFSKNYRVEYTSQSSRINTGSKSGLRQSPTNLKAR